MFISLEGIDGAGKGTLLSGITQWLKDSGYQYLSTKEPGSGELGSSLRAILLNTKQKIVPTAELFLYLADRAQHVSEIIKPALESGTIVISDRYADSTIVYQGYGRGIDLSKLQMLNEEAVSGLWPNCTFLIDVPAHIGLQRAKDRNTQQGLVETEGRFEAEHISFHERIRQGYLKRALENKHRFYILDGTQKPEQIIDAAQKILKKLFIKN